MSITIKLAQFLQSDANGAKIVDVKGSTVGECLKDLVGQFPELKPLIFDKKGKLHGYLDVFVNKKSSHPQGLDKPIVDGDELYIFNIIVGG